MGETAVTHFPNIFLFFEIPTQSKDMRVLSLISRSSVVLSIGATVFGMSLVFAGERYMGRVTESPTNYDFPLTAETTGDAAAHEVPAESLETEEAVITALPLVPPPINRRHPVRLVVHMTTTVENVQVSQTKKMEIWTWNKQSPGPFIRARQGDLLEVHHTNLDRDGIGHNIDFHAVTGPGGGASALFAETDETKVGYFRLLQPGLFIYHCAAGPVPVHIARGMYGLILVEPHDGLPPVDKEFAIVQSEIYANEIEQELRVFV
jgi:FtsP/CotA-like multicopper oxidase with cupredoxin domain